MPRRGPEARSLRRRLRFCHPDVTSIGVILAGRVHFIPTARISEAGDGTFLVHIPLQRGSPGLTLRLVVALLVIHILILLQRPLCDSALAPVETDFFRSSVRESLHDPSQLYRQRRIRPHAVNRLSQHGAVVAKLLHRAVDFLSSCRERSAENANELLFHVVEEFRAAAGANGPVGQRQFHEGKCLFVGQARRPGNHWPGALRCGALSFPGLDSL